MCPLIKEFLADGWLFEIVIWWEVSASASGGSYQEAESSDQLFCDSHVT